MSDRLVIPGRVLFACQIFVYSGFDFIVSDISLV
jgi:hypothetical protein